MYETVNYIYIFFLFENVSTYIDLIEKRFALCTNKNKSLQVSSPAGSYWDVCVVAMTLMAMDVYMSNYFCCSDPCLENTSTGNTLT